MSIASSTRRRVSKGSVLACAAALAVAPLALAGPASAAPGDNGDVKIHDSTTAVDNQRDDPKVCQFYLDAFNFDTIQLVSWQISQQPPTGTALVQSGSIVLTTGVGHTANYSLPSGHYKLDWTFAGEQGEAKHKVFTVDCTSPSPSPSPSASASPSSSASASPSQHSSPSASTSPSPTRSGPPSSLAPAPHGGVEAGAGGSVDEVSPTEIAIGGLLGVGALWFGVRTYRRHRNTDAR
ncbi:hypothetical protein AB0K51_20215 [Kitasatospora sp. NPDC049285]|uniref:hypothetical protein n=1 Tax=Kitasatospora sp. NPDC049285 TaxID=3157096 RepID=UPI0034360534